MVNPFVYNAFSKGIGGYEYIKYFIRIRDFKQASQSVTCIQDQIGDWKIKIICLTICG